MSTIQTPDGLVDFPDSMKDADIEAVLQKQYGAPKAAPATSSSAALFGAKGNPGVLDRAKSNFNANTQGAAPGDGILLGGLKNFGAGGGDVIRAIAHPIRTAESMISPAPSTDSGVLGKAENLSDVLTPPMMPSLHSVVDFGKNLIHQPMRTLGQIGTGAILGEGAGRGLGVAADAGGAIRDAALGDPNAAALKGLGIGPKSPKALGTIQSVEGARPFLQGADDLADIQGKVKPAKAEIWKPYSDALDAIGDRVVNGPDGPTSVNDLEAERLQLSAINRGLKGKVPNPESVQLAQQKGLNQAQALAKEAAVKAALDPELASTGINPTAIRKAFGQVSEVGGKVAGKTTLIEEAQPSGFGKILRPISMVDSLSPSGLPVSKLVGPISQIGGGLKDLIAGRPAWSAKPTDLGIREGFANAGAKPDFGSVTTTGQPPPPAALLGSGARPMAAPSISSRVANPQMQNYYYDTDAMRTGRLLNAPPIELGGDVEGPKGQPFRYDTTPMRQGRTLPAHLGDDMPLSSYHDIFPNQIPHGRLLDLIRESRK